jgi:hypothetical protein
MCLVMAITASYSMVVLAAPGNAVGELMVTGGAGASSVTVNGEPATSGRAIFSSSTISTPEGVSAAVNLGKAGNLQFAPNTTFTININGNVIGGDLTAGSVTVLNSAQAVSVKTLTGEVKLNAGETATAASGSATKQTTTSNGGADWWVYALIFGGATAGIILAATAGNDSTFGNGAITVSPVR